LQFITQTSELSVSWIFLPTSCWCCSTSPTYWWRWTNNNSVA